ncbi:MAG: phospholipase D-like domain-containing protein [Chitinophagia bacterium]|jgi:cardiolipin synthase
MSSKKKINTAYSFKNTVTLVKGGRDYFSTLNEMIRSARSFIQLQVYIYDSDETGLEVAKNLIAAAEKGVSIHILLDGYASRSLSSDLIKEMREAGIRLRFFEPLFKSKRFYFGRRMHHKILVCDGINALVGGMNISNRYNDLPGSPAWLDWAIKIKGEAAIELNKVCNQLFAKKEHEFLFPENKDEQEVFSSEKNCPVRIRRNDWVKNLNQISASYMEMFRNSTGEITLMSSYFIPSSFFRREMIKALQRGLKIKLILAGMSDVGISKNAERFLYRWALRNGMEIYEYKYNILHGKIAAADLKQVTLGSYNINDISARASIELNIDVEDESFSKNVKSELDNIIMKECIHITEQAYGRSLLEKFMQWLSYEIYKIIFTLFTFYFRKEKLRQ